MWIYMILQDDPIDVPVLAAFDVVGQTRRHYVVRQGEDQVQVPRKCRTTHTDPALAVSEYERALGQTLEALKRAIADAAKARRSPQIDVRVYGTDGNVSWSTIRRDNLDDMRY